MKCGKPMKCKVFLLVVILIFASILFASNTTEQSTPKTEQDTPKTEQNTPKTEQSTPKTEQDTPKTEHNTADLPDCPTFGEYKEYPKTYFTDILAAKYKFLSDNFLDDKSWCLVAGGTLMAYRDQNIAPWEYDVDIMVKDVPKFWEKFATLKSKYPDFQKCDNFRVCTLNCPQFAIDIMSVNMELGKLTHNIPGLSRTEGTSILNDALGDLCYCYIQGIKLLCTKEKGARQFLRVYKASGDRYNPKNDETWKYDWQVPLMKPITWKHQHAFLSCLNKGGSQLFHNVQKWIPEADPNDHAAAWAKKS